MELHLYAFCNAAICDSEEDKAYGRQAAGN